jgi:signal transduction histidine kinase
MSAVARVSSLLIPISPITLQHKISEVGDLFLLDSYNQLLSLPIVDNGRAVGVISRYELMKIFLQRYGRELYGNQSIGQIMNTKPLIVESSQTMQSASEYITEHIHFPIMEDFIITDKGEYKGIGVVLHLLKAMERQLAKHSGELAKAYKRLQESQAQLVQSEKMASLGQMVAGVAHEINTPLGYVRNNVEMTQQLFTQAQELVSVYDTLVTTLYSEEESDETQLQAQLNNIAERSAVFKEEDSFAEMQDLFKDTLYGVEQISELVLNLKNFSRLDQAKVDNISLNDCFESTLVIAKNTIKHKVKVIKQYGDIPKIPCSPSQINQVLLNLLTNAAQAMSTPGNVLLRTYADEKWVYAVVQDDGSGIPKEVLPKIFDPFFTTKPIGEGTGLGLSISYKIIQQHGGQIKVASQQGKGTRFLISLPIAPKKAAPPPALGKPNE